LSLFSELKHRNVLRVAVAYLAAAWLLIQVADTVFPVYGLGAGALNVLITVLAIGFPLFLLFSWVFEITPEGLKREKEVDRAASVTSGTGKQLDRIIIVLLAVALGYFAVDKFVFDPARDETRVQAARQEGRSEALVKSYGDKSIAVLAFADMSEEGDQEYLADGIAEELLNLLTKVPGLRVISRSSAFSFKGKDIDIPTIAQQLNVAHLLEGSVRKSGNQVRITAQLIEASSDTHLWSETYDRTLDNIFVIQDEIAAEVVAQLKVKLLGTEPTVLQTNSLAYTYFLRARHVGNQGTPEAWEQAVELYQQSLEIAPDYAPAWAGLAAMYSLRRYSGIQSFPEIFSLARDAAKRAVEADPAHALGHAMLGEVAMIYDHDLAAAARHLERALELEPANPFVLGNASKLTLMLGRTANTIDILEYLVARDPVSPYGYFYLGWSNLHARRPDEAIAALDIALKLNPGWLGAPFVHCLALLQKGQAEAALIALESSLSAAMSLIGEAMAYYALGRQVESDVALAELIEKHQKGTAYNIAYVMAYRGETDRAFEWLDKAIEYNDSGVSRIAVTPWFDNIHNDPRWPLFLESAGRSPEQLATIEFKVTLPK